MFQGPSEAPPGRKVLVFHVKPDPIDEAPPQLGTARDEVVHVRIDHLQWQRLGQRRRPALADTIDTDFEARAAVADAQAAGSGQAADLPEQHELLPAVPDQIWRTGATKGLAAAQVGHRLQQAGFAGGVRAVDQVEISSQLELGCFDATKVGSPEQADHYSLSCRQVRLKPHRHNHKGAVIIAGLPNQAARVAVLD